MRFLLVLTILCTSLAGSAQGRKMPPISFKANSVEYADANRTYTETGSYTQADTLTDEVIISTLVKIMEMNPGLVVQLSGHADVEEDPELGFERAMKVRDALIKKGIPLKRLEVVNFGMDVPILSVEVIRSLPTKVEQDLARQKNRRVEVSVLRTDAE